LFGYDFDHVGQTNVEGYSLFAGDLFVEGKRSLDRHHFLGIERVSQFREVNCCETRSIPTQIYRFRRSVGCSFRFRDCAT
jgi:hypothetical protein